MKRFICTRFKAGLPNEAKMKVNIQKAILQSEKQYSKQKLKSHYLIPIALGLFASLTILKDKILCIENKKNENVQGINSISQNQVQIFELNKSQLVSLTSNVNQQCILIIFDKYFRNQHKKQFAERLQSLYRQARQLKVAKLFLIDKTDIRHLEIFQKWLKNKQGQKQPQHTAESTNQLTKGKINKQQEQQKKSAQHFQFYFLTPQFKSNSFKIDQKQLTQQIKEIRQFALKINPSNIQQQIFLPFQQTFNYTTVIKQCPQFISFQSQNKCIEDFRNNIATLIQTQMLKNKSSEFKFAAITPNSKKDNSNLVNFSNLMQRHQTILNLEKQQQSESQSNYSNSSNQKQENTFVLRNDVLGRQIQNLKRFKKRNYSIIKKLTNYQKLLLFIKPRVFLITKANSSIDLYWYVTCLRKNKQPSISINNTDSFLLGRKFQVTDGLSYPANKDLEFLKILYKNHPQLNYVIINTQIVSELIRHLQTRSKYVIFNLTSDIIYPKKFLPSYNENISAQQNYQTIFKPQIQKYILEPKVYDKIVLDKETKINAERLKQMIGKSKSNVPFVLRVCNLKCRNDLSEGQMLNAYSKLNEKPLEGLQQNIKQAAQDSKEKILKGKYRNKVYSSTYWIDSYFNNVGLKDGDYLFDNDKFSQL